MEIMGANSSQIKKASKPVKKKYDVIWMECKAIRILWKMWQGSVVGKGNWGRYNSRRKIGSIQCSDRTLSNS